MSLAFIQINTVYVLFKATGYSTIAIYMAIIICDLTVTLSACSPLSGQEKIQKL